MLDANANMSKQNKSLSDWVTVEAKKRKMTIDKFCDIYLISRILDLKDFRKFIDKRKAILQKIFKSFN